MTQDIRTIRIASQGPAGPQGLYPQAGWDAGSVPYVRSTVLAHNGGVWLALRDTAVEPSADVPDDWTSWIDFDGMIGGFATLDEGGKIPVAQLPAIAITDIFAVASEAAMLALTAERGDVAIRSDLSKSFVLAADDASVLANWKELLTPPNAVSSVAGLSGAISGAALKTALAVSAADVSGLAASATTDTTNAANISSGTLPTARLSAVPNSALANSSVTLSGHAVALGGSYSLAQADVSGLTMADTPQFAGLQLATDVFIKRDAANTPALRNGTNVQTLNLYETYTDASNYSRLSLSQTSTFFLISTQAAGTGTQRGVKIQPSAAAGVGSIFVPISGATYIAGDQILFTSAGYTSWWQMSGGHLICPNDNLRDIGDATHRPRDFYLARNCYMANIPTADPHVAGQLWSNSGVVTVSAG